MLQQCVTGLPLTDVSELRVRLLALMAERQMTYADVAMQAGLKPHQVRDFLGSRQYASEDVCCCLCRLPLDLAYIRSRLAPRL